jgi:lipoic acid synthetase
METLKDMADNNCMCVTIGQYLKPSNKQADIKRFVSPESFNRLKESAMKLGFRAVFAGPFIRSSFMAEDFFSTASKPVKAGID